MAWPAIIAAVISAVGTAYSGMQQKQAADYNEAVIQNQAKNEELELRESLRRGRVEQKEFLSAQRARMAKSGVSATSGSSLLVAAETAERLRLREMDALRAGSARNESLLASAAQESKAGNVALTSGLVQAGASLIGGAAKAGAFSKKGEG